jgi:hypothetical protein
MGSVLFCHLGRKAKHKHEIRYLRDLKVSTNEQDNLVADKSNKARSEMVTSHSLEYTDCKQSIARNKSGTFRLIQFSGLINE